MTAQAVKQRVAQMGVQVWEVWRAVCETHPDHEYLIHPGQSDEYYDSWIEAQLDAAKHNHREHPVSCAPTMSWGEIMQSAHALALTRPEHGYRPRHLARRWFLRL